MKINTQHPMFAGLRGTAFFILLSCFIHIGVYSQYVVPVGPGSYASFPPTHELNGAAFNFATNANIRVAPGETRPIPTNDWWTNIIFDPHDQFGGRLWAMPMVVDPFNLGLNIFHPTRWNAGGNEMLVDFPVVLRGVGFTPVRSIATDWTDWSVDVKTYQDINNRYILTRAVHGSPFVWTNIVGFTPQIECLHGAQYLNANGTPITFPFTGEFFVILYWDTFYGVHLPPGTTVTRGGATGHLLTVNLPAGSNYIVFSALPNAAAAATLHPHAYVRPTGTTVSWNYNPTAGTLSATWTLATTNLRGAPLTTAVQGFLPHHYRTAISSNVTYNGITYRQSRGLLRMATGNSFTFNYRFTGILPSFNVPIARTGDANPYNAAVMSSIITTYANQLRARPQPPYASDTYWGGKDMVRMAKMMLFARETGHAEFTYLRNTLRGAITNWLTYTPGETEFYYAWYPQWRGLVGFNESFGSFQFTDHHFHYGYLIQAAALLGMVDFDFINQYSGILTMIAKQYANWDRADQNFPFLRTFDPWMGHSYAGGISSFNGNNQESTSEAVQSWHALFFLGSVLGNNAMRDAGAFGYLSESLATLEYWFNRWGDVWPAAYSANRSVVGILWPWGYVYGTYFGVDPQWIHGIQMLPISPGFHHFNWGFTPAQASTYYNNLLAEMHNFYLGTGNTRMTDGGVVTESEVGDWGHVLYGFKMLFNPSLVTQRMAAAWNSPAGTDEHNFMRNNHEAGTSYFYAHALQNLGLIQLNYHMSIPTSATYFNATTGQTSHVVFNPSATQQTVNVFRNGAQVRSFSVPARTLITHVVGVTNTPPTVSITSPANNASFTSPANITINASASDPDGSVTQVAFFNGPTLLGTDTSSPFSFTWSNVAGGSYSITARATDNLGAVTVSTPVNITVGAAPIGNNLALNRPVMVSSTENASLLGGNAVDGNTGTRWSSAFSDPQWISVDLGATFNLNRVRVVWEAAFARDYQVQVSPDGITWTTIRTVTGNAILINDHTGLNSNARFVRILGTARATQWGYSIFELEVFGTPVSTNLALNRPVTVSSTPNVAMPGSNAVDGNVATRWGSAFSDPQWIIVDLGATFNINRVRIVWEAAFARDYQVQVSLDGITWTTIRTVTGNTVLINDHTGLNTNARFVRIFGTARATQWGYSIFELEVFGVSLRSAPALMPETVESGIILYPVPVNNVLNIKSPVDFDRITIIDTTGRIIIDESSVNKRSTSIDVSKLERGVYIVRIHVGSNVYEKKIVK